MVDDFARLAADLSDAPASTQKWVTKALQVSAHKVDDSWSDRLKGSRSVPHGARSITYDIKVTGDEISAEVGPEMGRTQATIVGMLEVGTPTTGPRGFGLAALADNAEDFQFGILRAVSDALDENNL